MPNLRELKRRGVQGRNGLTQSFPPNTGVGWYSLATGAFPSKHGSTNNTFPPDRHRLLPRDQLLAVISYVPELKAKGVEAMVLLIHEGGTQDRFLFGTISPRISDITRALDPEVDVVMSGHSHTALNSRVDGRLVVQASSFGRAFEDVRLTLDRKIRDVVADSADLQGVWTYNPPDIADPAHAVEGDPAVQAIVDAAGESPLGNLIADAQRANMGTQFAFMNPGGIRGRIQAARSPGASCSPSSRSPTTW